MSDLGDLQNKFQDFLLRTNDEIKRSITAPPSGNVQTRLDIYGQAYRLRLLDALTSNYPVLKAYMGEDAFEKLSYAYIAQSPSVHPSIRWFGDTLAAFITGLPEYKKQRYLAQLAHIEWIMSLVFDAADAPLVTIEDMGNIPPEAWATMRFDTHPSIHLVDLSWNVIALWQAIMQEEPLPPPKKSAPLTWLFWRQDLINQFTSLSEEEAWALKALLQGATFGEIGEGLCRWVTEQEAGLRAATLLKGWIAAQLITRVII